MSEDGRLSGAEMAAAQRKANRGIGPIVAAAALSATLFIGTAIGYFMLPQSPLAKTEVVALIWVNIAIMLSALAVEASRRPYSLHMMHLLALFFFLGAPAILQYSIGELGVPGSIDNVRDHVFTAVLAVWLWLMGYLGGYLGQMRFGDPRPGAMLRFFGRPVTTARAAVTLTLALVVIVYLGIVGLFGVGTRGAAEADLLEFAFESGAGGYTLAFYLIHHVLLRAFSLVALLAALLVAISDRRSRNPIFLAMVAVVVVGSLIANNPFAAARMWFATFMIGFAAPLFLRRMKTGWALVLISFAGITLLPALHETRYLENIDEWWEYLILVSPIDYLAHNSDVDGLGMLSLCVEWTQRYGHRWGLQTIGSALFWFPRILWPHKPIETGGMVAEDLGFEFTNLATPVMSDALVDFDLPGILVVGMLFGYLLARADRAYWEPLPGMRRVRVIDAIYPFWIGCVLFFTRGGSFASLTFTVGFTLWVLPLALGRTRSAGDVPLAKTG